MKYRRSVYVVVESRHEFLRFSLLNIYLGGDHIYMLAAPRTAGCVLSWLEGETWENGRLKATRRKKGQVHGAVLRTRMRVQISVVGSCPRACPRLSHADHGARGAGANGVHCGSINNQA